METAMIIHTIGLPVTDVFSNGFNYPLKVVVALKRAVFWGCGRRRKVYAFFAVAAFLTFGAAGFLAAAGLAFFAGEAAFLGLSAFVAFFGAGAAFFGAATLDAAFFGVAAFFGLSALAFLAGLSVFGFFVTAAAVFLKIGR